MSPKPIRILLVEDDDAHAELIQDTLEENHVTNGIDRVSDGEQALAYLRQEGAYATRPCPDLILLDLRLPKLDGHEVLEVLKNHETLRKIPVVVLTTSAAEADKVRAYHNHANSYLIKPVNFEKFHEMIMGLKLYWSVLNEPPTA